ncbi:hypothetical protein MPER_04246 [Moniliophthora perniciosa FA553]|nr:hypothetical protein MPER_04246 [Moniliophthora perniciosa FA553]
MQLADAILRPILPSIGFQLWSRCFGHLPVLIGAQILSHDVDDFTLVAAFFLFSIGCLNMLLGLIFRESAKEKRSIRSWRADNKPVLPTTTKDGGPIFVNASTAFSPSAP